MISQLDASYVDTFDGGLDKLFYDNALHFVVIELFRQVITE